MLTKINDFCKNPYVQLGIMLVNFALFCLDFVYGDFFGCALALGIMGLCVYNLFREG